MPLTDGGGWTPWSAYVGELILVILFTWCLLGAFVVLRAIAKKNG